MDAFEVGELIERQAAGKTRYLEFLRVPELSAGVYVLLAGAEDMQQPHAEDEVYYVLDGRAAIDVAGESRVVTAGSIVYVAAGVEHRFHEIEDDLRVLVFFAGAGG